MTVSLSKSTDLRPSDGVRVVARGSEQGFEGYVRKTKPVNGDPILVRITKADDFPSLIGTSLSYRPESLVRTRRNGK